MSLALPPQAAGAASARRFVEETLTAWRLEQLVDDVLIVVTELVENVIKHTGGGGALRLRRQGESVLVEVGDTDARAPVRKPASNTEYSGRGLLMVEAIATSWGIRPEKTGKTVWATISAG